jgi:hypothetical protein
MRVIQVGKAKGKSKNEGEKDNVRVRLEFRPSLKIRRSHFRKKRVRGGETRNEEKGRDIVMK